MGKVVVAARIENLDDLFGASKGRIAEAEVRRVDVAEALVDTGATGLLVPTSMIQQLGLDPVRARPSRTVGGNVESMIYRAARLTVQGRDCICDVTGMAEGLPVIIGQIPLEALDWVVDAPNRRLIGNPEHGGEHMTDAL